MTRHAPNSRPRWFEKILAAHRQGLVPAGTLTHAHVYHDTWCALIRGRGPCNCDPDVEFRYGEQMTATGTTGVSQ